MRAGLPWRGAFLALVLASMGCGPETTYDDAPCPDAVVSADGFQVAMTTSPSHAHVADVVTFTFTVQRNGAAVDGLSPAGSYRNLAAGTSGTIALSGRGGGAYAGDKPLFTGGAYSIGFQFKSGDQTVARSFDMSVESH